MPFHVRAIAGRAIRRLGLLPGGVADGIGEDEKLAGAVLATRIAVFFPDPPENIYQLRQWLRAFETLDRSLGVTIIVQDSRTAKLVRAESSVAVAVAARTRTVGALLTDGAVRVVLYVGQANANASALRSAEVLHVFLNHGDSDKFVSVSNQVKAFDRTFVAGRAGLDRHASALMFFDANNKVRIVGRPQLPPRGTPGGDLTVLYAPTWEGTLGVNAYSSVLAFGESLVAALLADPELHVIYRPHPRTGVSDRRYREADAGIRSLVARFPERARVDLSPDPGESFGQSHVMISDVSAIATDWLGQGRPLVSTVPPDPRARIAAPARLFAETPHIDESTARSAAAIVRAARASDTTTATVAALAEYYLGGLTADEALDAFVAGCEAAVSDSNAERSRLGLAR